MVGTADAAAAAAAEGDEESRGPFGTPVVYINPEGWGPTTKCLPEQFLNVPFAPFGKGDRLGKAADFTQSAHYQARQQKYRSNDQKYSNTEFQYKHDTQEDQSFHLVAQALLKPFSRQADQAKTRAVLLEASAPRLEGLSEL